LDTRSHPAQYRRKSIKAIEMSEMRIAFPYEESELSSEISLNSQW